MNENDEENKTPTLKALIGSGFFVTNVSQEQKNNDSCIEAISKSQQCSDHNPTTTSKKESSSKSPLLKPPRQPVYSLPIIKNTLHSSLNDLLFRALHPSKPLNKSSLLNFNTNPKLIKSYSHVSSSSSNLQSRPISMLSSDVDELFKLKKLEELAKLLEISKNPYTNEHIKYFKDKNVKEIFKRSNYFNKVVMSNNIMRKTHRDSNMTELDVVEMDGCLNRSKSCFDLRKERTKEFPKVKDVLKKRIQMIRIMERNEMVSRRIGKMKMEEELKKMRMERSVGDDNWKGKKEEEKGGNGKTERKGRNKGGFSERGRMRMNSVYDRDLKLRKVFKKIKDKNLMEYLDLLIKDDVKES